MGQFNENRPRGVCAVCQKNIPVLDSRTKVGYCSRVCAAFARYSKRYRGTFSGPADKPTVRSKTNRANE